MLRPCQNGSKAGGGWARFPAGGASSAFPFENCADHSVLTRLAITGIRRPFAAAAGWSLKPDVVRRRSLQRRVRHGDVSAAAWPRRGRRLRPDVVPNHRRTNAAAIVGPASTATCRQAHRVFQDAGSRHRPPAVRRTRGDGELACSRAAARERQLGRRHVERAPRAAGAGLADRDRLPCDRGGAGPSRGIRIRRDDQNHAHVPRPRRPGGVRIDVDRDPVPVQKRRGSARAAARAYTTALSSIVIVPASASISTWTPRGSVNWRSMWPIIAPEYAGTPSGFT